MANKMMYLEANIELLEETTARRERASAIIDLPQGKDKQPDLQYFSAIFVSSGENLNHAYFMPSELVKAEGTIVNKALDIKFHNISELKSDEIAALCLDLWVIMILEDKSKKIIKIWTKKHKKKHNTEEFALTSLWLKYYDRFRTMLLQGHTSIKNFMEDL